MTNPPKWRRARAPRLALFTAVASLLVSIGTVTMPQSAQAAGTPKLERMLGWVTQNNWLDSEMRADFVIRVPAGELPSQIQYDWDLNGSLDVTAFLATTPGINQEFQIVSVVHDGAEDLVTITLRGDANYPVPTCTNQPLVLDNHVAVTVPSGVIDITGFTTSIQAWDGCANGSTRPFVRIPWDNAWNSPDGNSADGWGAITTGGTLPADKAIIDADNPNNATPADCGITDSVSYQWYQESSPGTFSPVGTMTTSAVTSHHQNIFNSLSLPAQSLPGPGYYKLLAWPNAKSSAGGADCSARTFTPGDTASAFTVGSVFNDYQPLAGAPAVHPAVAGGAALLALGIGAVAYLPRRRRNRLSASAVALG